MTAKLPDDQINALRRLLRLHLEHAATLHLLDGPEASDLAQFSETHEAWSRTDLAWDACFNQAMVDAQRHFVDHWRFRAVRPADHVSLCRVVPLCDLKYALYGTNRKGIEEVEELLQQFDALTPAMALRLDDAGAPDVLMRLRQVLLRLRAMFIAHRHGKFETLATTVHGTGSCWVSLRGATVAPPASGAQFWRDRLGLHHLPRDATVGSHLVRLSFSARLSARPCPANFNDYYPAGAFTEDIWLVRPTVGDVPNARFVQATLHDTAAIAARTGATIDLATNDYHEAEDELILLRGMNAQLGWVDLELLDGVPARHRRDDDHATFVELIGKRHAGLSCR